MPALRWDLAARESGYQGPDLDELLAELKQGLKPEEIKRAEAEAEAWLAESRAAK
jgi:hypothetical protein